MIKAKFKSSFITDKHIFDADGTYMIPFAMLRMIPSDMYSIITGSTKKITDFKTCLIIKSNGLGNAINIIPLIRKINILDPSIAIDVVCLTAWKGVFQGLPGVRSIYSDDEIKLIPIESKTYDIVFHGVPMGFDAERFGIMSPNWINGDQGMLQIAHECEVNTGMLDLILTTSEYIPSTRVVKRIGQYKITKPTIGICPGYAKGSYWDIKDFGKWQSVVDELSKQFPTHDIVILGQAGEWTGTGATDMTGKTSLDDLIEMVRGCDFVIGNDTGTMHLASAVGVKSFVIFGSTSWIKNVPWGNGIIIKNNVPCSPCQYTPKWLKCDRNKECFDIDPVDIVAEVKRHTRNRIAYGFGTYDRYEMICIALNDILTWDDAESMVLVIVNDGSTDPRIGERIEQFRKVFKGELVVVTHEINGGKKYYNRIIAKIIEQATATLCAGVLFGADDIVVNSSIITRCRASLRLIVDDVASIHFWNDTRSADNGALANMGTRTINGVEYETTTGGDGFLTLFKPRIFDDIDLITMPDDRGSGTWFCVNDFMHQYGMMQIRTGKSMGEHIGNIISSMNFKHRVEHPINAVNVDFWGTP